MKYTLNISDADAIFLDSMSRDIKLSKDLLPNVSTDDVIEIHYDEDDGQCFHTYTVSHVDNDFVYLEWDSQTSMLDEATPRDKAEKKVQKFIKKASKIAQKKLNKIDSNFANLAKNDIANGQNWKYYIEFPTGEHSIVPLSYEDAKLFYNMNPTLPAIKNAIVTKADGSIIRKGKEKVTADEQYVQGFTEVEHLYHEAWTAAETTQFNDFLNNNPNIAKKLKKPSKQRSVKKPKPKSNVKPDSSASTTPVNDPKPTQSVITEKTLKNLAELCKETGMQIVDEAGKREYAPETIPVSQISKYYADLGNNRLEQLDIWLQKVGKNPVLSKILKEGINTLTMEELNEATVTLSADELNNPDSIKLRDVVDRGIADERAETARLEMEKSKEELKAEIDENFLTTFRSCSDTEKCVNLLFDKLVPPNGAAKTVAGELIRAIVRLQYRDYNDGDKFFEGYGLETCASSASYLYDNGFSNQIQDMIDDAHRLSDNDFLYTDRLTSLANSIVTHIKGNESLMWTPNTEDSRDYDTDYIVENQPRYEFEISASEDVAQLVERGIVNAWDLASYVEDQLSDGHVYEGATVETPWSHRSTSVTVTNLTADGYNALSDVFRHHEDDYWKDFVENYEDELDTDYYDDDTSEMEDESEEDI